MDLFSRRAHEEVVQVSRDIETAAPLGEAHLVGILMTGTNHHILLPIPTHSLSLSLYTCELSSQQQSWRSDTEWTES